MSPQGSGRGFIENTNGIVEQYAKENNLWIPLEETFKWMRISGGNENDVHLSADGKIYKINNLINDKDILSLLERIKLHNQYFPQTFYDLVGFTGIEGGSIFPVLQQEYVKSENEASLQDIEDHMSRMGFHKTEQEHAYTNGEVTINDLRPRNVLKDLHGNIYVIDAGLKMECR